MRRNSPSVPPRAWRRTRECGRRRREIQMAHSATLMPPQATAEAATERLAEYAATLRYQDLPPIVVERAKHCLIDAIGCVIFGRQFPWSAMVLAEAAASGSGGPCRVPGDADQGYDVPQAALALGALAHAF